MVPTTTRKKKTKKKMPSRQNKHYTQYNVYKYITYNILCHALCTCLVILFMKLETIAFYVSYFQTFMALFLIGKSGKLKDKR